MLYYLIRPVVRYVLRYYYRNIDLTGLENIPKGAAVILAANHPTAFIEPCILACFQPRTLSFLARGDLFKNRFANAALAALNILPVYRIQDGGYGKMTRNFDTFDACHRALSRGGALMILAEGNCVHEKQLRHLRKGTGRIALGALSADSTLEEVYVVPVGINFVAADRWRDNVMISCGEPLLASDYLASFRENEATGVREFTAALKDRLSPLVIQLPAQAPAVVYETILEIARSEIGADRRRGITHDGHQLAVELQTIAKESPVQAAVLEYSARLREHRIQDSSLVTAAGQPALFGLLLAHFLLLPFYPFWWLAGHVGNRFPKTIEFNEPVRFAVVAGSTLLYLPILLVLPWLLKAYLIVSLVSVRWALDVRDAHRRWQLQCRVSQMVPRQRKELRELRERLL